MDPTEIIKAVEDGHVHDDEEGSDDNIILVKSMTMLMLFTLSTIFGLIPFKLSRVFKWDENARSNIVISVLLSFGGGVLLCTTFLHLLPEVNENIVKLDLNLNENVNLGYLLMCCGFFIIYLIEEFVHTYIRHYEASSLAEDTDSITRGIAIRDSVKRKKRPVRKSNISNLTPSLQLNNSTLQIVSVFEDEQNQAQQEEKRYEKNGTTLPECTPHEPHESHLHTHSHLGSSATVVSSLRGLLIVLALSIHELFEGLAIGLEKTTGDVWYMFGAVSAHKLVIAFCIGIELWVQKTKMSLAILYVLIFAIVSPLGIGIGMILSKNDDTDTVDLVSVILQGLASGTLLYIIFFEILTKQSSGFIQQIAIIIGFFTMFGLKFASELT